VKSLLLRSSSIVLLFTVGFKPGAEYISFLAEAISFLNSLIFISTVLYILNSLIKHKSTFTIFFF